MSEARQTFGAWCLLDPPLEVGGVEYGAAVRFQTWPGPHPPPSLVVSGVVESISGTTTKRIVCRREAQASSYYEASPPPGTQVPFFFVAGGNVCATSEAQRHYWHNNGVGRLGDLSAIRAVGGEALWEGGRAFLVTAALALEEAPGSVAWQEGASGPGRAPVCAGTVNLATADSTDVDENKLHWFDVVEIHDPNEECELEAGDFFAIHRNPVFDSRNPPAVEYDVRDGAGDWATLPGTEYLARWTEGIILIRQSWIVSEGWDTTPFCIRVEGVRFSQAGNMPARQLNDVAAALDVADELWCEVTTGGAPGSVPVAHGYSSMSAGPSEYACNVDYGLQQTEWAFGASWGEWTAYGVDVGGVIYYPPYYLAGYWAQPSSAFTDTTGDLGCDAGQDLTNELTIQPNKFITNVSNTGDGGTYLGREYWAKCDQVFSSSHAGMSASFNVAGIAFNPTGLLTRIPQGSTIIKAVARAKFDGLLRKKVYEKRTITGAGPPWNPAYTLTEINDTKTKEYRTNADGDVIVDYTASEPSASTSASLTFALIGVLQDTEEVIDVAGNVISGLPNHQVVSLGAGLRSTAEAGKWSLVDVTGAIQALVNNRSNRITGFYWWPSTGSVAAGASFESMGQYLSSLFGEWACDVSYDGDGVRTLTTEATTFSVAWSDIEIGSIMVQWRPPAGILEDAVFPLLQPPSMPAS